VKALLVRRHEATNVLEHAVGFFFFQWHTTVTVWLVARKNAVNFKKAINL